MRVLVEVKETELTKSFNEMEVHLHEAEQLAKWIETTSQVSQPQIVFEQTMVSDNGKFVFSMNLNLKEEKALRRKIADKAEELRILIEEYQKQLIKEISPTPDKTEGQG